MYSDGSIILGNGASVNAGQQFYINRNGPQLIGLNRRETNNPITPTGSYCCTVPTTGGDMTLCANLGECRSRKHWYWSTPHLKLPYLVAPSLVPWQFQGYSYILRSVHRSRLRGHEAQAAHL